MNTLNTYLSLCTQFYDLNKPNPPRDAYALYRYYVAKAEGAVLEPMCGSGRFLLPLLEEGFKLSGFDASDSMLAALHMKAKALSLKPHIWKAFLQNMQTQENYSLIFIPSGSFGLIIDLEQAMVCLKQIYDRLDFNGVFVFEIETLQAASTQTGIWHGSVCTDEKGQLLIGNFLDLPLHDNVINTICKYELISEQQVIKTEVEQLQVRLYEPSDLIERLTTIGFREIKLIKAFDVNKNSDSEDEVVVLECIK